ncbi:hypothetical protein SAMN04487780_1292 [Bacillus thuringiensis]|nr:hypothetical protein SAMN04487780_1292 [Bacillus thuringiensis]
MDYKELVSLTTVFQEYSLEIISPKYMAFKNNDARKMKEVLKVLNCPKCKRYSFKATFKEHPTWIRSCLCCAYKEVNPTHSPFVY